MAEDSQNQSADQTKTGTEESVGYFQEDNGTHSSMRLMCFISLLSVIVFGLITILVKDANGSSNGIFITFGFLVGSFAPKAVQKFAEQKIPVLPLR